MATPHEIPAAGALTLSVPAREQERGFELLPPADADNLDLRLIVMRADVDVPAAMTVTGRTVTNCSQMETRTGVYGRVRLKPGDPEAFTVGFGPSEADHFLLVRRRRLPAAAPGLMPIRFPRRPMPPARGAPINVARLVDLYASDPPSAFRVLACLSPSERQAAALALLVELAETDAEPGPNDPLLMILQGS